MKPKYVIALLTLAGGLACSTAKAWDQDFFDMYIQRSDTITLGAGNARDVNAATHVIDPWPRYVGNRRIPGNGQRMSGAIERYRDVKKLKEVPQPIVSPFDRAIGITSGGAGGGGGAGGAP